MLNFAPPIISDGMRYIKNTFAVQSFIHCATNNVIYTSAYIIRTMSYSSISLKKKHDETSLRKKSAKSYPFEGHSIWNFSKLLLKNQILQLSWIDVLVRELTLDFFKFASDFGGFVAEHSSYGNNNHNSIKETSKTIIK